jgi:hypothetical protein
MNEFLNLVKRRLGILAWAFAVHICVRRVLCVVAPRWKLQIMKVGFYQHLVSDPNLLSSLLKSLQLFENPIFQKRATLIILLLFVFLFGGRYTQLPTYMLVFTSTKHGIHVYVRLSCMYLIGQANPVFVLFCFGRMA